MEEINKNQCPEGQTCSACKCKACCGFGFGRYHGPIWLRWLLGIIILLIVFWLGLKVGEFRGVLGGYRNSGRGGFDMRRGGYNMMYQARPGFNGRGSFNQMPFGAAQPQTSTSTGATKSK